MRFCITTIDRVEGNFGGNRAIFEGTSRLLVYRDDIKAKKSLMFALKPIKSFH